MTTAAEDKQRRAELEVLAAKALSAARHDSWLPAATLLPGVQPTTAGHVARMLRRRGLLERRLSGSMARVWEYRRV